MVNRLFFFAPFPGVGPTVLRKKRACSPAPEFATESDSLNIRTIGLFELPAPRTVGHAQTLLLDVEGFRGCELEWPQPMSWPAPPPPLTTGTARSGAAM